MEVSPRLETPGVSAYPRSAVDEFLASGELEAHRLEQAIATAHVRTERATFVTERAEAISEMLHSILQDLRREFADRRLQVEAQAEGIVAAAHDEAARLLADARRDALKAAAKPQARAARPTTDSRVPAPNYRWVAASPPTPAEPATNPVPLTVSDATRPADLGTNGAGSPGVSTVAPVPDLAPARGLDVSAVAPAPLSAAPAAGAPVRENGSHASSPGTGTSEVAGDDMTTIDLTADAHDRPRAGLSRLLRNRRRDTSQDTGDGEFLDYLRGALVDDAPLHAEPDDEAPVDWRWTS